MSGIPYNHLLKLIPKVQPKKFPEPRCDPILEHCIKLRRFYNEIDHLVLLTANLKEIYEDSEREPILKALPPVPELPEFIQDKISVENLKNLELEKIVLSEDTISKLVSKAIARVMFIIGYTVIPSHLLQKISKMIVDYVKSLSEMIVNQMSEDGSVSLELFEAALQQKGIGGIEELHSFYTQRVVKFHDGLHMKCKHLCHVLKNNLKKPVAPPKPNISESRHDEKCSGDDAKGVNVEKNSTENFLHPDVLAENIFLNRKLKQKTSHFDVETESGNGINYKDSCEPKMNCDQAESPEKNLSHSDMLFEDLFVKWKLKQTTLQSNESESKDRINHENSSELKIDCDQEKFLEKNVLSSKCFSNLENILIERKDYFECTKTDPNLSSELSQAVGESSCKVTDNLFNDAINYSYDKPSDCVVNNFTNGCLVSEEKGSSYFADKQFLSGINRNSTDEQKVLKNFDEEMYSDEVAVDSKLINKSSDLSESSVTNEENATNYNIISKSYSKPENLFSENISLECTKYISDTSVEPYISVNNSNKMSDKIVCHSNEKVIHNHKAKKKSIESLDNSSTDYKKKRPRLMKYEEKSENGIGMKKKTPKIKSSLTKYAKSKGNCNQLQERDAISEENSYDCHNPELNSGFEVCSSDEIIETMTEESSSSENETEQIWVSL